ncbi:hypothetical protein HPG69_005714 [Diceros bicornis minor]|uniref:Uncharacterized protein n=1 Tax=Diceros bicornis minor TaxID=77932 RepID=A0A7J7ESN4_DICBM|nr:hypothetical protein HPG69_005714 [Diceros bicornis minor]
MALSVMHMVTTPRTSTSSSQTSLALPAWISLPFSYFYIVPMVSTAILASIWKEPFLDDPMFLSMLAQMDLAFTFTILLTVMGSCVSVPQSLAFKLILSFIKSSILMAKSFDYPVDICYYLYYASIFINRVISTVGIIIICNYVLPIKWFFVSCSHHLFHSSCLHLDMIRLVCAHIWTNNLYGFMLVSRIIIRGPLSIIFSYALI